MKKVLAICSGGGHWIQMNRLKPAFDGAEMYFASVDPKNKERVDSPYFVITDSNFDTKLKLLKSCIDAFRIVKKIKPHIVLSTGAAPGLFGILWGRFFGAKTLWVDSIANSEKLSLSAKLATLIADEVITQWPNLESSKVQFKGSVI